VLHECLPAGVYDRYWNEMDVLLKLPGKAHRKTVKDEFSIPKDSYTIGSGDGKSQGKDPAKMAGIVIDDQQAKKEGWWRPEFAIEGFVGVGYVFARPDTECSIRFETKSPQSGRFDVRLSYQPHSNHGPTIPVKVIAGAKTVTSKINMQKPAGEDGFASLGVFELKKDDVIAVELGTEDAGGAIYADAMQVLPLND
jgi:hypothetical protein